MSALLTNPDVISLLVTAVVALAGLGYRKLLALLDGHWSQSFLDGAAKHAGHATHMALIAYRDGLIDARDPDSDEGVEVTDDERGAALAAARDTFLEEISLKALAKALSRSRGVKVSEDEAGRYAEELVERAVDAAVPFDAALTK